MKITFRDRLEPGAPDLQQGHLDLAAAAALIRNVETTIVPGLLQVPPYTRAVVEALLAVQQVDADVDEILARRAERQALLYEGTRRFEFIVAEPVLRWRFVPDDAMRLQLDRLLTASTLPGVRLGIIPLGMPIRTPPQSSFIAYDDLVVEENYLGEQPAEGANATFFHRVADLLWEDAVDGDRARALVRAALDELA